MSYGKKFSTCEGTTGETFGIEWFLSCLWRLIVNNHPEGLQCDSSEYEFDFDAHHCPREKPDSLNINILECDLYFRSRSCYPSHETDSPLDHLLTSPGVLWPLGHFRIPFVACGYSKRSKMDLGIRHRWGESSACDLRQALLTSPEYKVGIAVPHIAGCVGGFSTMSVKAPCSLVKFSKSLPNTFIQKG